MPDTSSKPKMVAWYPKGIQAPIGLLAVMVPVGAVTERVWIKALSDRISDMVDLESNPKNAADDACKTLDCPLCDEPNQLGQFIVEGNLNLRTWINCSIISNEDPFSDYVETDDLDALEAIKDINLESWVNYAQYSVSGGALESCMNLYSEDTEQAITPCSELKPYSDFISKELDSRCEFDSEDSCSVYSHLYNFTLFLEVSRENNVIDISYVMIDQRTVEFDDLRKFEESIRGFNSMRIPRLSYLHKVDKKLFFSKPRYKVSSFLLSQKWSITSSEYDVANFFEKFYLGLLDLFRDQYFQFKPPEAHESKRFPYDFALYLQHLLLGVFSDYRTRRINELEERINYLGQDLGRDL